MPGQKHYWWSMKKGPHNKQRPVVFNKEWSTITHHVEDQLRAGVKIPYTWMEFGKHVIDNHFFNLRKPIMESRKMNHMRNPDKLEEAKYLQRREKCENRRSEVIINKGYEMPVEPAP